MVVWDRFDRTDIEGLRAPESRLCPFTDYVRLSVFRTKDNLHVEVPYTLDGWFADQRWHGIAQRSARFDDVLGR